MHVVIRSYSGRGASELFDLLAQRDEDVKELISGVPGFVSYAAFPTDDGGSTVTVCQDKGGTDESSKRAAAWIEENGDRANRSAEDRRGEHGPPVLTPQAAGLRDDKRVIGSGEANERTSRWLRM